MKKHIKKLLATTIAATTLLGSTLTACAYEVPIGEKDMKCGSLTLTPTPIYYETSKYPEINLVTNTGYLSKLKSDMKPKRANSQVFNVYYDGNLPTKRYSSGIILLGVKLNSQKVINNAMAALRLNRIDMTGTYVATYDIDVNYNALVRLEPSYSVFGRPKDVQLKYRINPKSSNVEFYVDFKVYEKLLMDNFNVTIKSTDGKYSYTVKADVLNYTGADPFSDEEMASEGRATILKSDKHIKFDITDKRYDIYFNDVKVASNVKTSDFRKDPHIDPYMR